RRCGRSREGSPSSKYPCLHGTAGVVTHAIPAFWARPARRAHHCQRESRSERSCDDRLIWTETPRVHSYCYRSHTTEVKGGFISGRRRCTNGGGHVLWSRVGYEFGGKAGRDLCRGRGGGGRSDVP